MKITRKSAPNNRGSVLLHVGIVLLAVCFLATGVQALRIPMDDAGLAAGADTIVQGTITSVQSQ